MEPTGLEIAVVGLACRFPEAPDTETFWDNLARGRESIAFFTPDELEESGVPDALRQRPEYVPARGVVDDAECFDAGFFGYSPREAQIVDPQQRLFLECSWAALEDAGRDPAELEGPVGLYGGVSFSTHQRRLESRIRAARGVGPFQVLLGNDKDFLATRVAYKLDLRGPALTVQTACSTSLVAVHMACRSLLGGECDTALAGGASVNVPARVGYLFQQGGILSPDGRCRAFDARAEGTVPGSGVGVVALKRLEDALADGDPVRAVIRGSAVNNDGAAKVGYTAPSVEGQARVIAEALTLGGVPPETLSYVEAHGTGTPLGDPIEIAALRRVLDPADGRSTPCALGSVKTNVGHLDAAAGVAGLIKTVLALERRMLPPSLHFERPNPEIDFGRHLYVNAELRAWRTDGGPRRAGVSSFGIGGTNAHVVLEEAPADPAPAPKSPGRSWHVLPLSARTPDALRRLEERLASHLARHPELSPADVAHTLQRGRRAFEHRRAVVAADLGDAERALRRAEGGGAAIAVSPDGPRGEVPDGAADLVSRARRWATGAAVDWEPLPDARRIPLPTYPFEREPHPIAPAPEAPRDAPSDRTSEPPEDETPRPSSPEQIRRTVAEVWRDVLGSAGADPDEDFFDAGGDSLAGLQIVEEIRRLLGVELPADALFGTPTLGGLGRRVREAVLGAPASSGRSAPLSLQQERLLREHRAAPDSPAHNDSFRFALTGPLDRAALRRSLQELVERHEILRTIYPSDGREGRQRILETARADLRSVDLRALPPDGRAAEADRLAHEAAATPFDPERAPHLRCLLARRGAEEHDLTVTIHRTVADGRGMGRLLSELGELYGAFAEDAPSPLDTPPLQVADHAVRQRELLDEPGLRARLRAARRHLAGLAPRPAAVPGGAAGRAEARLGRAATERVLAAGRERNGTLFMTVLAAWSLVLSRRLGRDDLVLAAPVAARERPDAGAALGFLADTLVLPVEVHSDGTLGDHWRQVRRVTLEALARQDLPCEVLVEGSPLDPGDAGRIPFDAALVAQKAGDRRALTLAGIEVEGPTNPVETSPFGVTLYVTEAADHLALSLVHERQLWSRVDAEAALRELTGLLDALASTPDHPISDLESEP